MHLTEKDSGAVSSEKRFLWIGSELSEERDASGGAVTKRFFGQGEQRIGGSDAGVYFDTRDHLGSIREMTDSGGNVRARYEYDVWGQRSKVVGDLSCDFGFTGHYVHEPSALNMALYRAYDAILGRWINRDPIREAGGLNLYGYVGSNPANFIDPLGLLVEVYYENIGPSGGGSGRTAAWIFGGQHAYVHIQTPSIDVTVELEGPHEGRPYGNITIRDFDPGRGGRKRGVKRPCPEDDYSFEHNLLDEFSKYYDDPLRLPDYAGLSQNSNTFANHLVASQGGSINDVPLMAIGSGNPFTPDRAFRLETTAPEVISRNAFGPLGF